MSGALLVGLTVATQDFGPAAPPPSPAPALVVLAAAPGDPAVLDPRPILGPGARGFAPALAAAFQRERLGASSLPPHPEVVGEADPRRTQGARACFEAGLRPAPQHEACGESDVRPAAVAANAIPLPVPKPAELREPDPAAPRLVGRQRRVRQAAASAEAPEPSFLEKLFGVAPPAGPAYAALDGSALPAAPAPRISPSPAPSAASGIAVYDIGARTVRLPNGETLEAHSGLGDKLDDVRFAHIRMRGVTPPGTYDLTEREAPFHGVRAIRLNPVGGASAVFGRAGLLAHTYLLGPNGDSNGCVSFRDYDRFLQAYLRGEIRQLVVVPGRGFEPAKSRYAASDAARG